MLPIMIMGTSSDAGKTSIVAGLCRLFANRGLRVSPFKAQNMALNSFVTVDGGEIARSIAMQAAAARQEPIVHMNPILLKPKRDDTAQLIVQGKPYRDVNASEYFAAGELQQLKLDAIQQSFDHLAKTFELVIVEGAGSCAEPNLREFDVVNMGLAERIGARVYIVVDINKGGAFADILGTIEVFKHTVPRDIDRIEGFVLNKFRGDFSVLKPALQFAETHSGKPIVGVLPYLPDIELEEEDRIREFRREQFETDIAVIYLPHISNANDFDFLAEESTVQIRYVRHPDALGFPDAVIIPGTKNTTWDLNYIRRTGLETRLKALAGSVPVMGICGGYEMLGRALYDREHLESEVGTTEGMGLLDFTIHFEQEKILARRVYLPTSYNFIHDSNPISGYEIRAGRVSHGAAIQPAFAYENGEDGAVDSSRLLLGTFIHDVFSNAHFTRAFINFLRQRASLPPLTGPLPRSRARFEETYERLASALEEHCGF